MSKYKAKAYAKALVDLDTSTEDKKVVNNFLKLLERNGDMKKFREIIALAQKLLLQKTGNKKIALETARKINAKDAAKSFIKKGDMVEEKINPALIAGVKIVVDGNRQLDFSLKNKLDSIF